MEIQIIQTIPAPIVQNADLLTIRDKIYEIRGYKVMLDFDLAEMYGTETKRLKEAVRRNIERFEGDDFMFQLSREEVIELSRTQFASLNKGRGYNIKYCPFAFSELGVSMLSSVINSITAIGTNRNIMRAFAAMRNLVLSPADSVKELQQEVKELKQYVENVFSDYNDINEDTRMQIGLINESLAELQAKSESAIKPRNPIGYTAPQYLPKPDDGRNGSKDTYIHE